MSCLENTPCNQSLYSTSNVKYTGPNLPCTDVDTCDTLSEVLQKAENVVCQLKTQLTSLQNQLNSITTTTTSTTTITSTSTTSTTTNTPTTDCECWTLKNIATDISQTLSYIVNVCDGTPQGGIVQGDLLSVNFPPYNVRTFCIKSGSTISSSGGILQKYKCGNNCITDGDGNCVDCSETGLLQ
jgi:hypothetical protein